jgi:hypothetical protein
MALLPNITGTILPFVIMRNLIIALVIICFCTANASAQETDTTQYRDLYSDTWVGTDALGRKMPLYDEVGSVKKDHPRIVGIFYVTWHTDDRAKLLAPYTADVTKILAADSAARLQINNKLWKYEAYHWGEPEYGYFLSRDKYVIRHDMSMLTDAGVDVIIFDVTNGVRYWDQWETIMSVMEKMKSEGNKVPKICFWAFNGPVMTVVQDLYDKIYKADKYADLWFYWKGKPLLLFNGTPFTDANDGHSENLNPEYDPDAITNANNPHHGERDYTEKYYSDYSDAVKQFFTTRNMWWGYYKWAGKRFVGTEDNWSFGYDMGNKDVRSLPASQRASLHNGELEEMAVTPAQHSSTLIGKSWSTANADEPALDNFDMPQTAKVPWLGRTVKHPEGYGIYFQDRWDEALNVGPSFIYLNDWNEWTAGKYPRDTIHGDFMRRKNSFFFVDQYNAEFNRTIAPMKGGYTDNYYMQMAENIRRYKGVRDMPKSKGYHSIKMNGTFKDWKAVDLEYRDTKGDVLHRDNDGYGGTHYTDNSGRNDILTSKVAVDNSKIYFYAATDKPFTSSSGKNWMLLLIDADQNSNTGWYGYDYIINKKVTDPHKTTLMRYVGTNKNGHWVKIADLDYEYKGNQLEIAVPRNLLKLTMPAYSFDFHWCDNPVNLIDPISLSTSGDSAPNRRFNYRFTWSE